MSELTLKGARDLAGLTQRELDRRARLPNGTTHDLEAGRTKRPAHDTVVKVIRALQRAGLVGVTADQIFPVPDDAPVDPATSATVRERQAVAS